MRFYYILAFFVVLVNSRWLFFGFRRKIIDFYKNIVYNTFIKDVEILCFTTKKAPRG